MTTLLPTPAGQR